MAAYDIRVFPDPVLRQRAAEITEIDDGVVRLARGMIEAMHEAPGIGLAAVQVGVLRRLFVYDVGDGTGAHVVVNPVLELGDGEAVYDEGCLSIPGLTWAVVRPPQVHLTGVDLDGNDISLEADELVARVVQHEVDHLDGILFIDRLDPDERKAAMAALRDIQVAAATPEVAEPPARRGLRLPGLG